MGSYFAVIKYQGKQHRHCLRTKDRKIARKKLAEYRQQLRGHPAADNAALNFEPLSTQWLEATRVYLKPTSAERLKWIIAASSPYFPMVIRNVRRTEIEQWASIRSKQVTAATFNKELDGLRLMFQFAVEHDFMLDNPAAGLRRRIITTEKLTPIREQFGKLVRELRGNQVRDTSASADLVEFLACSGCRLGEAMHVRWADINWKRRTLTISGGEEGTKSNERRVISLFPSLERLTHLLTSSLMPSRTFRRRNGQNIAKSPFKVQPQPPSPRRIPPPVSHGKNESGALG